jgi:hypothetical protein
MAGPSGFVKGFTRLFWFWICSAILFSEYDFRVSFQGHIVGIQGDVIKLDWFKTDDIHVGGVGGGKIPFSVVAAAEAPYFVRKVLDFCFIS